MKRLIVTTITILLLIPNVILGAERVSLGFLYNSSDSINLVRRTNGSINEVAPAIFDISKEGNLEFNGAVSEKFMTAMKEDNISVTPFLSNHWNRNVGRAALKNKEKLTDQIVDAIEKYDFDGINVDIENLTSDDRDNFSEFVRMLREKLQKNKKLTVSVSANPYSLDTGWQGSYDYDVLGELVDYLCVMTYDEHSIGGAEGPVASGNFVELSIQYALRHVDKSKIVIGIPLYGRYWRSEADLGGEAIVIGDVQRVVKKFNGKIEYDNKLQTPKATFYVPEGSEVKVNGEILQEGEYTVWYENEQSIKYKLELVNKYNLKGAGLWALGQEKVEVWKYYKDALNEAFEDEKLVQLRETYEILRLEIEKAKISIKMKNKELNVAKANIVEDDRNEVIEIIPKRYERKEETSEDSTTIDEKEVKIKDKIFKKKIKNMECRKIIK